jgi:hypothetical protein
MHPKCDSSSIVQNMTFQVLERHPITLPVHSYCIATVLVAIAMYR